MSTVNDLIKLATGKSGSKKTKNNELFLSTIQTLCVDDEHTATYVKGVTREGELITEKRKLAPEFRKILARALKERTSMTMEEAEAALKNFKLTVSEADSLYKIVMEAVNININDLNKKVQIVATPELYATISSVTTKEIVKNNPKDPSLETVIKARKKLKTETKTFQFQKESRKKK